MAKRIGGIEQQGQGDIYIECLEGMDPQEQVEAVAASFAKISCEYAPVDISRLPPELGSPGSSNSRPGSPLHAPGSPYPRGGPLVGSLT